MATAVLMQGNAQKAAGDSVRMACDWGDEPLLIAGATITSFNITCSGVGAPTVTAKFQDYAYQTSALIAGGVPGSYELVFSIVLNDSDASELVRTGVLRIL